MKKIITAFMILIASYTASAQMREIEIPKSVQVGKVAPMGTFIASMEYTINEGDTTYDISFRNAKYTTLTSIEHIRFSGEDGTLDAFYNVLKTFFDEEHIKDKEYTRTLKLGKTTVIASNMRSMGMTSVMVYTSDGYFMLSEKWLNKLFGK